METQPRTFEDTLLKPAGRVLPTLEADGSRRWMNPRLSTGNFWQARRVVAYVLLAIFTLVPYFSLNGHPLIQLDVVHRRFHILGATFLPTDTKLLALLVLMFGLSIFLFTAIAGRVFCGWACPQTVYLEFVYRPLERLFFGTAGRGGKAKQVAPWRRVALYAVYLVLSVHLAQTLLSYFIGVRAMHEYILHSNPFAHPAAFVVVAIATAWMMWDFAYWREQMCLIGCPYGRFQSVLLDRWSKIVSYDRNRGEPRGKGARKVSLPVQADRSASPAGDCIDCSMCVQVCPTGIDIRDGLQFECVNCTQCIDACNVVMDKVNKPRGLIGYSSQAERAGEPKRFIRPRVIVYPLFLLVVSSLFFYFLFTRPGFDLTVLRAQGRPFVANESDVVNVFRLKVVNRTDAIRSYRVEPVDPSIHIDASNGVLSLNPLETTLAPLQVHAPRQGFTREHMDVEIRVISDAGEVQKRFIRLVGPTGSMQKPTPTTQGQGS